MESKKDKNKGNKFVQTKRPGHKKLKSSGQLLPTNHNFKLVFDELPESFFEEIVKTEIDLSEEFSMDKIYSLIRLYSEAIEYYLQNDPPKVKYYQGRMELLLTNKDTMKKLKKESQNITIKNSERNNINNNIIGENSSKNNLKLTDKSKSSNLNKSELIKKIELQTDNLAFDDISIQVNKVMGDEDLKNSQIKKGINIVTEELQKQNENWKEKLKKKKKNFLSKSMNFRMKHQRGISLDLVKSNSDIILSKDDNFDDPRINNKFENMSNIFEEVKEVKEENEGEGSDKEHENENKINDIINNKDGNEKNKSNQKENIVNKEEKDKNIEIDEKIMTSVNERMDLLMKLIDDIENNKIANEDDEDNLNEKNEIKEESDIFPDINKNIIEVPLKFQAAYYQIENLINNYMDQFNSFFFKDIFDAFASNLKDIYDNKYKKYTEVRLEYHHQIKENEHILEINPDYSEEKKAEINQIIDSLKDEQQNQIAKIEDEFNRLIVSKVNEFKINSFKNNSGILLIEEKLKLDIYSIINDSFYNN